MIERLRIQCPACGTFLEVNNSKNEAVKHITCPKCRRQLSVDFQEKEPVTPKPLEALYYGALRIEMQEGINQIPLPSCDCIEINVVRLNDGNSKCLVRTKSPQHKLFVNGKVLSAEDQVSLASGDELRTGNTILTFGVPGNVDISSPPTEPLEENETETVIDSDKPSHNNYKAFFITLIVVAVIFGGWLLLNKFKSTDTSKSNIPPAIIDTIKTEKREAVSPTSPKWEVADDKATKNKNVENQSVNPPKAQSETLSDYQLEINASKGDTEAQFELGNRLIRKTGKSNVLKGLNYLKLAAQNGSQKARSTYRGAVSIIRQKAENGDEVANEILMSIE